MERTIAIASVLALALVACQQQDPNNFAIDDTNALNADVETLPPDEGNEETAHANEISAVEPPTPVLIPAGYHGRWGMVSNDCQPGRADAKGLITIGDTTVRYYEAVATLKEQRPAIATSFSGLFAFSGEGQNWEKVMTFTRTGNALERAEDSGTFTYRRCR